MNRVAIFLNEFATVEHMSMFDKAAQAARRHIPDCHVEVVGGKRPPDVATSGEHRSRAQGALDGEVLFMDVDCEIRADVSEVWKQDFDIALPLINDPHVKYTGGVVFSRSPAFWIGWADEMARRNLTDEPDVLDQLQRYQRFIDNWPGKVLRLDYRKYEFLPLTPQDPCKGAAIVHYRGPRKSWWKHGLG